MTLEQGKPWGSSYCLPCVDIMFVQHHLMKLLPFCAMHCWHLCQILHSCSCVDLGLGPLFSFAYLYFLVCVTPKPFCHVTEQYNMKLGVVIQSGFFLRIAWNILSLLCWHIVR